MSDRDLLIISVLVSTWILAAAYLWRQLARARRGAYRMIIALRPLARATEEN